MIDIYSYLADNRPVDKCWCCILGARVINHVNKDGGNSNLQCKSQEHAPLLQYTSSLLSQPLAPFQEAECVGLQIFLNSSG